ncbi:hypothetical protein P256_00251 [Acinetobacter nectaris CIP 110549]|uniref:Uncharacterized protein n=1 Tax=Acinetobacter nectaris CIP 110549 TaxID=1392540 RepID=V2TUW3_9GAMM|nr:hypothetical protein [Acinetobacter nectaris]ESK41262.1 hypothetical protein P256_00251 [Acinetobacter nectaris CIP 110549]
MDFIIQFLPPALDISKNIETGWSIKDWLPIIASGVTITTLITTLVINNKYQNARQSELINAQESQQIQNFIEQQNQQERTFKAQQDQQERLISRQKAEFVSKLRQERINSLQVHIRDLLVEMVSLRTTVSDIQLETLSIYKSIDDTDDTDKYLQLVKKKDLLYKNMSTLTTDIELILNLHEEDNNEIIQKIKEYIRVVFLHHKDFNIDFNLSSEGLQEKILEYYQHNNLDNIYFEIKQSFQNILKSEQSKIMEYTE